MIRVKLYQNKNEKNETAFKKWYPRVVNEETIGLDELSEHMASHNTPFSKGAIKGILTDAVACAKNIRVIREIRVQKSRVQKNIIRVQKK